MNHIFLGLAGLSGFLSVALGAFGAHALKSRISAEMMAIFQTGNLYHQIHAVALLVVALMTQNSHHSAVIYAGWLFVAGTVVFSGSLYALALTEIRILGAITPIGGLAFLGGWGALVAAAFLSSPSA